MNEEKFIELVTKYLSREATPDEVELLRSLLKQESNKKLFDNLNEKWNAKYDLQESSEFDLARGFEKLTSKILKYEPEFNWEHERKHSGVFVGNPWLLKIAASIIFFIVVASAAIYLTGIFNKKAPEISWNEKSTQMGEKSIVTLLDGTVITINADSKVKYPAHFSENTREVYLEGEAYFVVEHDSHRPFIVHSGDVSITDIGTQFDISAFPDDESISVSLIEGKVKVATNDQEPTKGNIILSPNQQLVYSKSEETSFVGSFNSQSATGWKDNEFVFDNVPLEKVFVQLERAYGVKIECADKSIASKKIKANFKNESIWTVAEVIKKATGYRYKTIKEQNELKKIVFYKK